MCIHQSGEDYLEVILVLKKRLGMVRSIDIVNELHYKKPSVSVAMKKLRESGYITTDKEGYISLTEQGQQVAEQVYERHQVLTSLFTALGVDPVVAAEDACKIEHDLSQQTFECLKAHLKKVKQ